MPSGFVSLGPFAHWLKGRLPQHIVHHRCTSSTCALFITPIAISSSLPSHLIIHASCNTITIASSASPLRHISMRPSRVKHAHRTHISSSHIVTCDSHFGSMIRFGLMWIWLATGSDRLWRDNSQLFWRWQRRGNETLALAEEASAAERCASESEARCRALAASCPAASELLARFTGHARRMVVGAARLVPSHRHHPMAVRTTWQQALCEFWIGQVGPQAVDDLRIFGSSGEVALEDPEALTDTCGRRGKLFFPLAFHQCTRMWESLIRASARGIAGPPPTH